LRGCVTFDVALLAAGVAEAEETRDVNADADVATDGDFEILAEVKDDMIDETIPVGVFSEMGGLLAEGLVLIVDAKELPGLVRLAGTSSRPWCGDDNGCFVDLGLVGSSNWPARCS
jgi:hypothetical protein